VQKTLTNVPANVETDILIHEKNVIIEQKIEKTENVQLIANDLQNQTAETEYMTYEKTVYLAQLIYETYVLMTD
jgi:hypothetical protein